MEQGDTLARDLLAEEACPVCGGHHGHEHHGGHCGEDRHGCAGNGGKCGA